ncbi:MFS transporter [Reyranella soli]|uniref:MFS transporter n=1 Tax=Reyranella soli TaxID=1230389 RepID=UPI0014789CED|nr:MFS transporter [Reyranella soli]
MGSWFVPLGIQQVLFAWLAAIVLHMDAFAVGIAQVALMAPSILFLPLGGLVADRGDARRLLLRYHLLYAVPPLVLIGVLSMGGLSYPLLIAYGLAAGSIGAFAVPTRDALLPMVAGPNLPRAVALATALQFIGQLLGIAAASEADRIGAVPLLIAQSALVAAGAIAVWRLPKPSPHPPVVHPSFWRSIGDGIAEAARSEQMWPVLLLNFGVGVFYVGPFMAVLPIVVRDVYHGGAAEIAYINLAFWAGTIVAAFAFAGLARRLSLRGRLVVSAVSVGAVILGLMALQPPFLAFNALCFIWGLGAGITLTQGRTILQIVAPPTHRARVMALFQLGLGGGGPIGAFIAGSLAAVLGLKLAMVLPAIAMTVLIGAVLVFSRIWSMRTVE